MVSTVKYTLPARFYHTLGKHSERIALTMIGGESLKYGELHLRIMALIAFLEKLGVKPGNTVAILSAGMPNWGVTYYAITFMGAIAVPILPDFHQDEVRNILEHSEAKAIIFSEGQQSKVTSVPAGLCPIRIKIEDFTVKGSQAGDPVFELSARPVSEYDVKEDDLASIIYTSGTTVSSRR